MKTPAQKKGHGGARSNAGVKAADGVKGLKRVNVTLDEESDAIARRLGDGDRSLGLRRALRIANEQEPA